MVLAVLAPAALTNLTKLAHAKMPHSDDAELAIDELILSLVVTNCGGLSDVDIHGFFEEFI